MELSWRDPGGLSASCACPGGPGADCRSMTDLLDLTQDLLTDPGQGRARDRLSAALSIPTWERDLAALDDVLGTVGAEMGVPVAARPDDEGREPGWRLVPVERGGWTAQPAWTRPYKRKAGLRTWQRDWREIESAEGSLSPADRAVIYAIDGTARSGVTAASTTALASLTGHPRVVLPGGQQVAVDLAPLALSWSRRMDGGVDIAVTLGGVDRVVPDDFRQTLERTPEDGGLLAVEAGAARVTVVEAEPAARDFVRRLLSRGLSFPADATAGLLARLAPIRSIVPVHLDDALRGRRVEPAHRPVVRLTPHADGTLDVDVGTRPLEEGPVVSPGDDTGEISVLRDAERIYVERDHRAEEASLRGGLSDVFPEVAAPPWSARLSDPDLVLDRVSALQALAGSGEVEVEWTRAALRVAGLAGMDHLLSLIHI